MKIQFNVFLVGLVMMAGLASCGDDDVTVDEGTVYFLVSEMTQDTHMDSYILPLSDPVDIATAREMIAFPEREMPRIVTARIVRQDPEGLNRDLIGDVRIWSWKVTQFGGFADNTIEIIDGWPTYVEENLDEFFRITGKQGEYGNIGFWAYSVTREIDPKELGL